MATPEIRSHQFGCWQVFQLKGEIDLAVVPALEAGIAAAQDKALAIELAEVGFMDSSGLRAMLTARSRAARLVLVSPSDPIKRLLDLAGVADVFTSVDSLDALPS